MYTNNIITCQIFISPNEINVNLDDIILKKLQDLVGNKCIKYGYVERSSIKIIKRSLGKILTTYLNGDINYIVKYSANICNPQKNLLVSATVKNVNKMGLLLEKGPLSIVVARQLHKDKTQFTNSNLNKELPIVIKGNRFDLNSDKIICLGILYDSSLKDEVITEINSETKEIDLESDILENEIELSIDDNENIDSDDVISNQSESDESPDDEEYDDEGAKVILSEDSDDAI
jgi:DNA-directed RNA polymerase subunit E'/Rpb7